MAKGCTVRLTALAFVAIVPACGGGGSNSVSSLADPNPPDVSFMSGSIAPPGQLPTTTTIAYTDSEGNTFPLEIIEGKAIVIFEASVTDVQATSAILTAGGSIASQIPSIGLYLASMPLGNEMAFVSALRATPGVIEASVDVATSTQQFMPQEIAQWDADDPSIKTYLERIRAFEAWDLAEGALRSTVVSSNVILSVLDHSFDNPIAFLRAEDFSSRIAVREVSPLFSDPHGLDAASLAAATGNNSAKPLGIDWYSPVRMAVGSTIFSVLYTLLREVGEAGAEVVSMSLGIRTNNNGTFQSHELLVSRMEYKLLKTVVEGIVSRYPNKQFLLVKSAGNDNVPMGWTDLKHDNLLVVGACTPGFVEASYSNYGEHVDVFVPGSTSWGGYPFVLHDDPASPFDGGVFYQGGTSFSAPIAAGLASLLFRADPSATAATIKSRIVQNALVVSPIMRVLDAYASISNTPAPSLPVNSWAISYGTSHTEFLWSVEQTNDGGFIAAGEQVASPSSDSDGLLFKVGNGGALVWQKAFHWTVADHFYSVRQTADAGFVVAGSIRPPMANDDAVVMRLDANGVPVWQKAFVSSWGQYFNAIQRTSDGGFIACGLTGAGSGDARALVVKLASDGTVQWGNTYGNLNAYSEAITIEQTQDSGYIVGGKRGVTVKAWVFKLNSAGALEWQQEFGSVNEAINGVDQAADGSFIAVGWTSTYGTASTNASVIKINPNGTTAWYKVYSGANGVYLYSVIQEPGGNFLCTGQADGVLALNLTPDGSIAWQKVFGDAFSSARMIRTANDGGAIVGGFIDSTGTGSDYDAWLLKVRPDGTCPPIGGNGSLEVANVLDLGAATAAAANPHSLTIQDISATITDPGLNTVQQAP